MAFMAIITQVRQSHSDGQHAILARTNRTRERNPRVPQCNDSVTFLSRPLKLSFKHSACVFWTHLRNIPSLNRRVSAALQWSKFGLLARRETSTRMKISNAARLIFWVAVFVATGFLAQAESGDRRASMSLQKQHFGAPIRILDQNGQPAVSGMPSATSTIVDVMVGAGNGFQFVPDTVNISVGDTVRWTWSTSGHSVTSGPPCVADSQYCSPNDMNCASGILSNSGTVYTHTFARSGRYSYFCASHCVIGMTGVVNVSGGCAPSGWSAGPNLPSAGARLAGVYFQANGKFYGMGGRASDSAGSEFTHPFEYDPGTNSWTTKSATYPDAHVNNMACGVLADAGTH